MIGPIINNASRTDLPRTEKKETAHLTLVVNRERFSRHSQQQADTTAKNEKNWQETNFPELEPVRAANDDMQLFFLTDNTKPFMLRQSKSDFAVGLARIIRPNLRRSPSLLYSYSITGFWLLITAVMAVCLETFGF